MIPWNNSWLQLAAFVAVLSGGILILDLTGTAIPGGGGTNHNGAGTSNNSNVARPPPANLAAKDANAFTNSLGMKFMPAGTAGVLFSIWNTRIEDFQQFVNDTGYNAIGDMSSMGKNGWARLGATWSSPGYDVTPDSPVTGISWHDANQFCLWLTNKERQAGLISNQQTYRLPTDAEWTAAAGSSLYFWGDQWPPDTSVGNYRRLGDGWTDSALQGTDGYAYASPVGTYSANAYGLYDMGGNVIEWCADWYHKEMNSPELLSSLTQFANDGGGQAYRVLRGASWNHEIQLELQSKFHSTAPPEERESNVGFRVVLTKPTSWWTIIGGIGLVLFVLIAGWRFYRGKSTAPAEPA